MTTLMATLCDPFRLFPHQVQTATLWRYTAPGLPNERLADLQVIVKHSTQSDQPTEYGSRIGSRSFHIDPSTLPFVYVQDIELLPDLMLEIENGRVYQITDASRGDDMTMGETRFITVTGTPYGRDSI